MARAIRKPITDSIPIPYEDPEEPQEREQQCEMCGGLPCVEGCGSRPSESDDEEIPEPYACMEYRKRERSRGLFLRGGVRRG